MKRALKKDKAVPSNTQNEDSLMGQEKPVNPKGNRQLRTSAAMIGLAISMGASSLVVTQQSDKALAADPVGESSTSTTVATTDAEATVAPSLSVQSEADSSNATAKTATKVENPVAVIRKATELEASLRSQPRDIAKSQTQEAVSVKPQVNDAPAVKVEQRSESVETVVTSSKPEVGVVGSQSESVTLPSPTPSATEEVAGDVDAQLKEKQELALHQLKAKSNRLKDSLAELRSEETSEISVPAANDAATTTVVEPMPATVSLGESEQQPQAVTELTQSDASVSQQTPAPVAAEAPQLPKTPVTQPTPVVTTPQLPKTPVTQPTPVVVTPASVYQVRPGDTLGAIARRHGITVADLVKVNSISDPNRLQINQKISIPTADEPRKTQPTVAATTPRPSSVIETKLRNIVPPVKTASLNPIVPAALRLANASQTPVAITVPTPIAFNNQETATSESATSSEATSPAKIITASQSIPATPVGIKPNTSSIGATVPPKVEAAAMQLAQFTTQATTTVAQAKPATNQYVQNLQAEIERLREKYRSQQANNPTDNNVVVPVVSETNKPVATTPAGVSVPVTVPTTGVTAPTEPVNPQFARRLNNQPIQPQVAARPDADDVVNPEFVSGRSTGAVIPNSLNTRNITRTRVATAPIGVDAFESLGNMRGRQVAPELPPLAPSDNFLPNPSNPGQSPAPMTGYIWPARGVLTSGYGPRWGRMHRGIDIAAPIGTPIYAAANGVVIRAGWNNGGYGKMVEIRHTDGTMTRYAHNSRILVQEGQLVQQGQQITEMGSTGYSTGPHLHFEVHPGGRGAVNPMAFLPRR